MKQLLLTLALVFAATAGMGKAAAQNAQSGAEIKFQEETHDYGTVKYAGNGTYEFKFSNTGTAPLIISDAKGSCGCTVPVWSKEPIAPGASGVITVKYDTKRAGHFEKTVTVTSNAANSPTTVLHIKGIVSQQPEGTSPVNTTGAPTSN